MLVLIDIFCLSKFYYFYLEINWITIIAPSFKHNSCESADDRSKHSIYRAVIEVLQEFNC